MLAEATLTRPATGWAPAGGRDGVHTEHLSYLLAEMQVLHRAHPGATVVSRSSRGGTGDRQAAVAAVVDPEIRVVTIDELGILRAVDEDPATGRVTVTITPTYSGCPAMDVIRADIRRALRRRRPSRRRGPDRLRARLEHRLDHRRGPGQARRRRHRPAGPGRPAASCR